MAKTFIFTVTTGRSGASYLTRLLAENLINAEVHHERLGYQSFGTDTPDASHFTLFNSVGDIAQVKKFWRRKLTRVAQTPSDTYAEISHFNAKAGLIENLALLREHGDVHIILLRRDPMATLRSFHSHHDFANLGFTWLFALDPRYPNKIIAADEHMKLGAAGAAYWYIQEMTARAAYYRRLIAEIPAVHAHSCDLSELVTPVGATALLQQLGAETRPKLVIPKRENATENCQIDDKDEALLAEIVQRYDMDCRALGEAFFERGQRLSEPSNARKKMATIVLNQDSKRDGDQGPSITLSGKAGKTAPRIVRLAPKVSLDTARPEQRGLAKARQYFAEGDHTKAKPLLETVAKNNPTNVDALEMLGATLYYLGDLEGACGHLLTTHRINPNHGAVCSNLAAVLLRLDRPDEALAYARDATIINPDDRNAWLALGNAHGALGQQKEAIAAIEHALALDGGNIDALSAINKICFEANRLEDAVRYGEQALKAKDRLFCGAFPGLAERYSSSFELKLRATSPAHATLDVVAFSLWGDKPIYSEGMVQNAQLARDLYPGWQCRLYHDGSVETALIQRLNKLDVTCIRVDPSRQELMGTFWRFLASDDPEVRRFVCRDADARLSRRRGVGAVGSAFSHNP